MRTDVHRQQEAPVAFFIFNREACSEHVFKAIRDAKPKRLFLIVDGPSNDNSPIASEEEDERHRQIEQSIDWECEVSKNYSESKLGYKKRMVSGLNWVFQQTEQAIILEDDCLPDVTFFPFCQELLKHYAKEERVMAISGNSFLRKKYPLDHSYYCSHYMHCWGWATWRRAWQHYSDNIESESQPNPEKKSNFSLTFGDTMDTWHSIWSYHIWARKGLIILPNRNLVSNVGSGMGKNFSQRTHKNFSNLATFPIAFPLHHPPALEVNRRIETSIERLITKSNHLEKFLHHLKRDLRSKKKQLRPIRRKIRSLRYLPRPLLSETKGNQHIARIIESGQPAAIGKIGSVELSAIVLYEQHKREPNTIPWDRTGSKLYKNAGVFPAKDTIFNRFAETFIATLSDIDTFGVWFNRGEARMVKRYAPQATLTQLGALDAYIHASPWSRHLENKKVLVIHPFTKTIEDQYKRRAALWSHNPDILPEFELKTIKTPLSHALVKSEFKDWFETLSYFKKAMLESTFDIALIGAGAWSLPLAVEAKKLGKIGIHLGGATQILFGIKGRRWDKHPKLSPFFNDAWVRPSNEETPQNAGSLEKGCYW